MSERGTDEVPWDSATDHLEDILEEIDLPEETADRAEELAARYGGADPEAHVRATPPSIAAGALYCASLSTNFYLTQAEIADAADISGPSLRNAWKPIAERESDLAGDDGRGLRRLTGGGGRD